MCIFRTTCQSDGGPSRARARLIGLGEAGRPASNYLRWSHAIATNFRKESRASTQRRWPDGRIPRPTGLGEAGRPLTASVGATQPPPTSGRNPEHPLKGGGQMAASPGRPAGLGKAGQAHLAASSALPWRERQAQLPYLCTTDAQLRTNHGVV